MDYFHYICEKFTDTKTIENFYATKTQLILKNLNNVITSQQNVIVDKMTRHISCAVDTSP